MKSEPNDEFSHLPLADQLTSEQLYRLITISRNRKIGYAPTSRDIDFLLSLIMQLLRGAEWLRDAS
jgi:hypothetical protein